MTESHHHDLLDDFLDAERRAPGPSSAQQARVRAAIAATVAAAAVTGAATATTGSIASTTTAATAVGASGTGLAGLGTGAVLAAALAATVGGAVVVSRYEPAPAVVDVVEIQPPAPPPGLVLPPTMPAPDAALPAAVSVPVKPALPAPTMSPIDVARAAPDDAQLVAAEREHLGRVRIAMNAGDLETALQLLQVHVVSWPHGRLVEEREALTVLCLSRLGRVDSARDAARAFAIRWPQSLFRDAIEQAAH